MTALSNEISTKLYGILKLSKVFVTDNSALSIAIVFTSLLFLL